MFFGLDEFKESVILQDSNALQTKEMDNTENATSPEKG